jgi:hypothetical protein
MNSVGIDREAHQLTVADLRLDLNCSDRERVEG